MGVDLERLVKAVEDERWKLATGPYFPSGHEIVSAFVRAILQELREPSEGMLESVDLWAGSHAKVRGDFQAMIDHILAEP